MSTKCTCLRGPLEVIHNDDVVVAKMKILSGSRGWPGHHLPPCAAAAAAAFVPFYASWCLLFSTPAHLLPLSFTYSLVPAPFHATPRCLRLTSLSAMKASPFLFREESQRSTHSMKDSSRDESQSRYPTALDYAEHNPCRAETSY